MKFNCTHYEMMSHVRSATSRCINDANGAMKELNDARAHSMPVTSVHSAASFGDNYFLCLNMFLPVGLVFVHHRLSHKISRYC